MKAQHEKSVGIFVLSGLACLWYFAFQLGTKSVSQTDTYPLRARFSNLSGLSTGATVSVAGVSIGAVTRLSLSDDFSAIAEIRVRKEIKIPDDSVASVRSKGLLGDKFIALSPGGSDHFLTPDALITDTESSVDLESLLSRFAFGNVEQKKGAPNEPPSKELNSTAPEVK
jgi:phospholipid/cholesterol/gamma-HCH transport system substrate-binding protein